MSKAVVSGQQVVFVFSDAADFSAWPVVADLGHLTTVQGVAGQPLFITFAPPAGVPVNYLQCLDGVTITVSPQYAIDRAEAARPELTTTATNNYLAAQQRKAASLLKKGSLQAALKLKGVI